MRSVIKKDHVHLIPSAHGAPAQKRPAAAPRAEQDVRLVRVDGVVRAIEFRCSCGDVSLIELEYGPEPEETA